jgi:hypothetical protein
VRVYFEDQPPKVFSAAEVRLLAPPGGGPGAGAQAGADDGPPPQGTPSDDGPHE